MAQPHIFIYILLGMLYEMAYDHVGCTLNLEGFAKYILAVMFS